MSPHAYYAAPSTPNPPPWRWPRARPSPPSSLYQNPNPDPHPTLRSKIQVLFKNLDADGSGGVDVKEFLDGLQQLGLVGLTESQLAELFRDLDKNQDGSLTLPEFTTAIAEVSGSCSLRIGRFAPLPR